MARAGWPVTRSSARVELAARMSRAKRSGRARALFAALVAMFDARPSPRALLEAPARIAEHDGLISPLSAARIGAALSRFATALRGRS